MEKKPSVKAAYNITQSQNRIKLRNQLSTNAEAHHLAASYLISSNKFDEARTKLREGIELWFEKHEMVEDLEEAAEKEKQINPEDKLDVGIRMGALRLAVELEMWEEGTQIGMVTSDPF